MNNVKNYILRKTVTTKIIINNVNYLLCNYVIGIYTII